MPVNVFVPREQLPGEHRVALVPAVTKRLTEMGANIMLETDAGTAAGLPDEIWQNVNFSSNSEQALAQADLVLAVRPPDKAVVPGLRAGCVWTGFLAPYQSKETVAALRDARVTSFAMELVPRISRAQSMDALSSQAAAAGYKAALMAADKLQRFFPMLTTAAGTIRPAKVLVIGAGVAGLQAIATARRLGAMVQGYDVRSAAREQVESLGAKFIDTGVSADAEGGYARELTAEERQQQQEALSRQLALADAVISTAAVPGKPAPRIISAQMVKSMKAGAVIVDLAAESGGNCELTKPGENVREGAVEICGPTNLPSMLAEHASEMYAKNLLNFITPLLKEGRIDIDWDDEIYANSVLTHDGAIRNDKIRELVET